MEQPFYSKNISFLSGKLFRRVMLSFMALFVVFSLVSLFEAGDFSYKIVGSAYAEDEAPADGDAADGAVDPTADLTEEERQKIIDEAAQKIANSARLELDGLEDKRVLLREKEEVLQKEEARLEAFRSELQEKIDRLEEIHRQIEASLAKLNEKESEMEIARRQEEDAKIRQLVKVYSGMKPKNAGAIFDKMDTELAYKIFTIMKGDMAGRILAYVDSEKAAKISERIAMAKIKQ